MEHSAQILTDAALLAGILILENGGETFRVEETVVNFCMAGGCNDVSAIAFPTGIFMTVGIGEEKQTIIKRINKRGTDLYKLAEANGITRRFVKGEMTLDEAYEALKALSKRKGPKKVLTLFASAVAAALFAVLFGGSLFDGIVAFVAGFLIRLISCLFRYTSIYNFAFSFIGGATIALCAVAFTTIFKMGNIGCIVVGATMPILPGLMLTGAIRDSVMGDLIAGAARLVEALLVAVAIAAGVGIVLSAYISMGGVV